MSARNGINQLRSDPNPVSRLANTSLHDVLHAHP
jgi:hypothetical protein